MNQPSSVEQKLWIDRVSGVEGWDLWVVSARGPEALQGSLFERSLADAERRIAERAELASFSVLTPEPLTFFSGRTAELIGIVPGLHQTWCTPAQVQTWLDKATLKGLVHEQERRREHRDAAISVAIDAGWLGGTESGAQVAVTEMIRELARRPEIGRVTPLSESGAVPANCHGLDNVSGASWSTVLASDAPPFDILHRPYQPGTDVDFRRYLRAARSVAVTVLDFIAYDNPLYHESHWAWRQHQQAFDEAVCLADYVFGISQSVATRLERQFAHQLAGPVRAALLGTDHLQSIVTADASADPGPALKVVENARFLVVLGNDFEHKNRDFAVKVFADLRERGYDGRLVLAGFHLDRGSSFDHELSGAGRHAEHIIRLGSVSAAEKTWLLRQAEAVLYATSAEGFGLVPFEAAALGTPTAFVKFGPLLETLPDVDASVAWQVRPFADHVLRLLANPAAQVAQIRTAGAALTWSAHVDQILAGYQYLMSPGAAWRTRVRRLPTWQIRASRAADGVAYRVRRRLRRLAGKIS